MKQSWLGIHDDTFAELNRRYHLDGVDLKHPFPERPWRLLGLLKFDGEVYSSERFVRALLLKTSVLGSASRSLLLCPRPECNFPIFSNETILMGKKVLFLVDVQQVFPAGSRITGTLFDDLQAIRLRYPDLLEDPAQIKGEIARGFSPAAVYVRLDPACYARAAELLQQYLLRYLDELDALPACVEMPDGAQQAFDDYASLVIDHDPAMRFLKRMFGEAGASERAYDMFFGK